MKSANRSASKQSREALEKIAENFRALSESTRLAILQELKSGAKTVNELVEAIGTSQPNVSKQLRVLLHGGFVSREQRGTFVYYEMHGDFVLRLCDLVCDRLNKQARAALPHYRI
jgi:DNA-binding transcriptional ArsR family regulator